MSYSSRSIVVQAGVNTTWGGAPYNSQHPEGSGAVWVWLRDSATPVRHDRWFEVLPPWDSQILAVALAAISSGKNVMVTVSDSSVSGELGPAGEPLCYTMHLIA